MPRNALRSIIPIQWQERLVARSGLFDREFYLHNSRDVARSERGPLRHYLLRGWREGRAPHALFDGDWYLQANPDVARAGANPLVHFLRFGAAEGRNPNPFFDLPWYVRMNPDLISSGLNPVAHFTTLGASRFADPSPAFSTRWYLDQNPDVAASRINPLAHYLLQGRREGRLPKLPEAGFPPARAVAAARIECLKLSVTSAEIALFVTHSRDGLLRPHVRPYLEALRGEGIAVVLIVATNCGFREEAPWLRELVDGLFVRGNEGFDFAAWAHVMRLHPELRDAAILYWVNDSVIGPVNEAAFRTVVQRIRESSADLVGLTENFEPQWHVQSYFLALQRRALASEALRQFVANVVSFVDKRDVIDRYEVQLPSALAAAGLVPSALFKARCAKNPLAFRWKELLGEGFPFIKINTVRDEIPGVNTDGWRERLRALGYDVTIAQRVLTGDDAEPA